MVEIESLVALVLIAAPVLVPLVWLARRDRRAESARSLEARLQAIANQRLGGESYLLVTVEPARAGGGGRVVLSAPDRYRFLVDEVWRDVRAAVPADYDLVAPGEAPALAPPAVRPTARKAA